MPQPRRGDPAYRYSATIDRVIDGDTLVASVDLGFQVWLRNQTFRVLGINARELTQPGGPEARDNLTAIIGPAVTLTSIKPDKYGGRMLAVITLADGTDLSLLVATGWAATWDGTGPKPSPPWPRTA